MANDKLIVQIAWDIGLPKGAKIRKKVFQQLTRRLINNEPLPRNVEVKGIFWRNPNRRGNAGGWRYHNGADVNAGPSGDYDSRYPQGTLRDAVETLATFLEGAEFTL